MGKDIEPYFQSGVAGVEHRDIDKAGSDHPFGKKPKEWEADLRPLIRDVADSLYDSWEATIREYLANAETACLKVSRYANDPTDSPFNDMTVEDGYEPRITVVWDKSKQKLTIQDNGIGMAGIEVDKVFRYIGRTAARDLGTMSGEFGIGALSFLKFIGTDNSTMVMLSNSRLNDDNAAYLVSLAGIEPVMGSLGEEEFGTKFKLDQKKKDMEVRGAVEKFAEWMRVPVLYRELNENGEEIFNEDWGDRRLFDEYDPSSYATQYKKNGFFEAYMSPDATGRTLLLSMDIDRNFNGSNDATWPFDVRLLDESGRVVESSNGNEGLIPVSRPEYDQMLLDERSDHITEQLLTNRDVVAHRVSEVDADYVISEEVLESDQPLPVAEYTTVESVDQKNLSRGTTEVILGPHSGRMVVSDDAWDSLPEGRAAQFVVEGELEPYDLDSGEGDLRLPEPTTDRSSLQENDTFWRYIGRYFTDEFNSEIQRYKTMLEKNNDIEAFKKMDAKTVTDLKEDIADA